jgi:hypothetical protein
VQNSRLSSSSMRRKSPRSRTLRMIMHDRCTLIAYIYQVDRHTVQGRQRGGPMGNHRRIYLIYTPNYWILYLVCGKIFLSIFGYGVYFRVRRHKIMI